MPAQSELDRLVELIRAGIAKYGAHVLDARELTPVLEAEDVWDESGKRERLRKFAESHGFDAHWSAYLQVAVFRKPDHPGGSAAGTKAQA